MLLSAAVLGASGQKPEIVSAAATIEKLSFEVFTPLYNPQETKNQFWKGLDELTDTDFNPFWVPVASYPEKLRLLLSSGDLPDTVVIKGDIWQDPSVLKAVEQGLFKDITSFLGDLSKYPNLKKALPPHAWKLTQYAGKNYGVPRTRPAIIGYALMMRKDWLDRLNLPVPSTVTAFYDSVKKMVNSDLDGNGKQDTVGMAAFTFNLLNAYGFDEPEFNETGGLKRYEFTGKYMDFIAFFRKAYAEGLLSKEFPVLKDNQYHEMFLAGRMASDFQTALHAYEFDQGCKKVDPRAEIAVIPALRNGDYYTAELFPGYDGAIMISSAVSDEKAKRIIGFYEKTASDAVADYIMWGKEGVHYTSTGGVRKLTELGAKEINNSNTQCLVMPHQKWSKVDSLGAPDAFNVKIREIMSIQLEIGKVGLFQFLLKSNTWTKEWGKYVDEFTAMRAKAVIGSITLDEFKNYLDTLEKKPEIHTAFKEFAESYKEISVAIK
jgi:putative aldouronate transport system substrate-binding protein